MPKPNRNITIHKWFFEEQARKIKAVILEISQKDSLSAVDTKAIRILTNVYDSLSNPHPEKYAHHQANCNNGHDGEVQ